MVWFEWDEGKAKTNERKHGVRFDDAILVFADPYALMEQDRIEGGELRWQTIGLAGGVVLLLVAHTIRDEGADEIIRIISARKATWKECKHYDENREENTR
jgi:uncharacterized DUF497 family protein